MTITALKPGRSISKFPSGKRSPRGIGTSLSGAAVLAGSLAWSNPVMTQEGADKYRLEYRLEETESATPQSAKIKFTLTNRSRRSVRLAVHNTPLKGEIGTRMFDITCVVNDREEKRGYQGVLKSADKPADAVGAAPQGKVQGSDVLKDLVLINPGESRDAVVDLVPAYSLPDTGHCKVAFTSLLNIVDPDGAFGGQPKYEFVRAIGEPLVLRLTSQKD